MSCSWAPGRSFTLVSVGAVVLACGSPGAESCTVVSRASAIVGGALETGYLGLSESQSDAVVVLELGGGNGARNLCTGVVLSPDDIVTAAHCLDDDVHALRVVGRSFEREVSSATAAVIRHPERDVAVLHVPGLDAPHALRWAEHDLANAEAELAEIAGAGFTADGGAGAVTFAVARVVSVTGDTLIAELPDDGGPCGGDSGGPLLVRSPLGAVTVAGLLSNGAPTCRGPDTYERIDRLSGWLSSIVHSSRTTTSACETLGEVGRCFGQTAVWCEGGQERATSCDAGSSCGFSAARSGYRCVPSASDPCEGVSDLGTCFGQVAARCVNGAIEELSCEACGGRCVIGSSHGKSICLQGG